VTPIGLGNPSFARVIAFFAEKVFFWVWRQIGGEEDELWKNK
jgi:hypothetical protein